MRTTVTIEEDVARRLREVSRRREISFKEALNTALRQGLDQMLSQAKVKPFHTKAEDMGVVAHLNYDNIANLLELTERRSRR